MNSISKGLEGRSVMEELFKWLRPVAVYIVGVIIYNFVIVGNLVGIPGAFSSIKEGTAYKIACNFELNNKGFLSVKSKKIQLNLPIKAKIKSIDIPKQYNYLYKIIDGGVNYDFVIFLVDDLKRWKSIKGGIVFQQHSKWEKDYLNPISF